MSHVVRIETQVRDPVAIEAACHRLNGNRIVTFVAASDSRVKLFERYSYRLALEEKGRLANEMYKAVPQ